MAAHDRLELALQFADGELELAAVVGVLEDFPGPEEALADAQAVFAELAFRPRLFSGSSRVSFIYGVDADPKIPATRQRARGSAQFHGLGTGGAATPSREREPCSSAASPVLSR
jgi:hypothetical protein